MAFPWFDTIVPAITVSANTELSLALGTRSLVYLTGTSLRQIFGIAVTSPGGVQDGMDVTLVNVSNGTLQLQFIHESGSASAAANRFRCKGASNVSSSAGIGSGRLRYDGAQQRWYMLAWS